VKYLFVIAIVQQQAVIAQPSIHPFQTFLM